MRVHVWVSGRVQGVFFRESARQEADRLHLMGWVQNLPDGRVEAVIQGEEAQVHAMLAWCKAGPAGARVDGVEAQHESEETPMPAFHVRRG